MFLFFPALSSGSPQSMFDLDPAILTDTTQSAIGAHAVTATNDNLVDDSNVLLSSRGYPSPPSTFLPPESERSSVRLGKFMLAAATGKGNPMFMEAQLDSRFQQSSMTVAHAKALGLRLLSLPKPKRRDILTPMGRMLATQYVSIQVLVAHGTTFNQGTGPIVLNIAVVKVPKNKMTPESQAILFGKLAIRKLKDGGLSRASSPGSVDQEMKDSMEIGPGSCTGLEFSASLIL